MSSPSVFYNDSISDSDAQNDSSYTRIHHELDAHFIPDASVPLHSHLYEQIDQLEAIDMDELVKLLADSDDSNEINKTPVSLTDFFEGLAQLATIGVVEITEIVEAIHREVILRPLGRFNDKHLNKWSRGFTGRIYGTIRHVMQMVGNNLASVLRIYKNLIIQKSGQPLPDSLKKLVNVLNGVMGDHLVNNQNAIAIPMMLYTQDGKPQNDVLSGRIAILCHGLCMSHLSWHAQVDHDLGEAIHISQPDTTVLYLDYNTGRRISRSGRKFSQLLQALVDDNPNITQIDLVGHSMGGLVARSALFYGEQDRLDWIKRVGNLITLGSPHHGAVLERIGNYVQDIIAKLPFAGSLAKLGDMRSAGIIDLRHGSIRDADWKALEGRSVLPQDFRHPAQLPSDIKTYFVASALLETHYDSKVTDLLGDSLVSVASALGEDDAEHALFVPDGHKAVFYGVNHMNLIHSRRVREQVVEWLLDNGRSDYAGRPRIHSYPRSLDLVV
ncbi:alpha/beta fold hydrolase [Psychrobacter sp. AOP7-C1-14]|uniref:alpha/beta fold hydrolase n=1 Tax=Psychrobacter sp. AOP7-C1-14 TaxID=3457640 RepID=UPI00402B97AB